MSNISTNDINGSVASRSPIPILGQQLNFEEPNSPEFDSFVADDEELAYRGHEIPLNGRASNSSVNVDDAPKVRYSLHQTRSISLDVSGLKYVPARSYVKEAIDKAVNILRLRQLF